MEPNGNNSGKGIVVGLLMGVAVSVFALAVCAFCLRVRGFSLQPKPEPKPEPAPATTAQTDDSQSAINDLTVEKIKMIEDTINTYYYKTDIDRNAEADSIYKGVVASLADPYSEYYTPEEYNDLMSDTQGIYYGIGAYVSMDKDINLPRITGTIKNSPAEKVGLMANDIVSKVDDTNVQGMTLSEVVKMIRGEIGTTVKVTVYREDESDYLDFDVTRDKVESPTVNTTMLEDNIGYLGITEFDSVTPDQFLEGMDELRGQGMKALVLDLRSNPGGSLSAVCEIARHILPEGNIVYTVDRDGNREDYTCDGNDEIDIPVAVLVNGYSASASEILSGAIKDYGKGKIIGETTYGKGVVQRIFPFSDGTAVKLTISNYFTPNGNDINGVGIEPDIEIALDSEAYSKDGTDNQLNKAIEVIKEELGISTDALDDAA